MSSPDPNLCPECGQPIPTNAPAGLCPACVVQMVLQKEPDRDTATEPDVPAGLPRGFVDYEILEEIGRGGMGVVYRARQKSLNRVVALKMMLGGQFAGTQAVARFRIEAEATAQLQHPNIVAIHEVGEHEGLPYLTMDYVPGRNLAELAQEQPLPARSAATYLKTIAQAVQYAHEQGVLHRDLKPSNVLIDGLDEPRITDFGLAKRLDGGGGGLTVSGQTLGSPNFMPPEQAGTKRGTIGPVSDVYGLGATLYYLVTGRPPFVGENIAATARQVLENEPVTPRLLNPRLPRDLETICLKCLEKDPAKRYGTAKELAEDLGRFLGGEPIRARPVGAWERGWRWCRRRPGLAGALAGVVLLFVLGSAGVTWQWLRAEANRAESERNLYVANMNLARQSWDESHIGRMRRSLWESQDFPDKGFEWYYLQRLAHPEARRFFHQAEDFISGFWFTADSRRLVCWRSDSTGTAWDTETGEVAFTFGQSPTIAWWTKATASPDDSRIASKGDNAGTRVWDMKTGQLLTILKNGGNPFCFSGDGRQILASYWGSQSGSAVAIYDAATGELLRLLLGHTYMRESIYGAVQSASWSPNGQWIVTAGGSGDATVRLWDAITGAPLHVLTNHTDIVSGVVFSPDSTQFVSASRDNTAIVWEAVTGQALRTFRGHDDYLSGVAYSPDGRWVVTVGGDLTARLWDPESGLEIHRLKGHSAILTGVAVSPDGRKIAVSSQDGTVTLWSVNESMTWQPASDSQRQSPPSDPATTAGHDPESVVQLVMLSRSVAEGWELCVPRAPVGQVVSHGPAGPAGVAPLAPTNHLPLVFLDNRTCGTVDTTHGTIVLWDIQTRSVGGRLNTEPGTINLLALSSDRNRLLVGKSNGTAEVWDVSGQQLLFVLESMAAANIFSGQFSPDGRRIVTATVNYFVEVWDAATGARNYFVEHAEARPDDRTPSLEVAPDSRHFVSSSGVSGLAWLWKFGSQTPLFPLRGFGIGLRASFSPDGRRIVMTSSINGKVIDAASGGELCTLVGHSGILTHGAFSPNGRWIVTGSYDRTVRVWNARDGRELLILRGHVGRVVAARFSPDGQQIYSVDDAGILRIWATAAPGQVAAWAEKDRAEQEEELRLKNTRKVSLNTNSAPRVYLEASIQQVEADMDNEDAQAIRKAWRYLTEAVHWRSRQLRDPWLLPRILGEVFEDLWVPSTIINWTTLKLDRQVHQIRPRYWSLLQARWQTGDLPVPHVLIQTNAVWKYRYDDQDLGADWIQPDYQEDAAWKEGPAVLGYEKERPVITTEFKLGKGSLPRTAYFRTGFRVEDPQAGSTLWLRLLVDDGAVVYLNGTELLRFGLPNGPIRHDTLSRNHEATQYLDFSVEPGTFLRETNLLAVEVHQNQPNSSDLVLGLELLSDVPTLEQILQQAGVRSLSDCYLAALYLMNELSPKTSPAARVRPVPRSFDHLVWQQANQGQQAPQVLIPGNATWRFLDDGSDQGTAWKDRDFNDRLWKKGPAPLGYPKDLVATELNYETNALQKRFTTYFRTEFTVDPANTRQPLLLRLETGNTNGAIIYLNGQELLRNNMPLQGTSYLTPAIPFFETRALYQNFILEPGSLLGSTNILAVELHRGSLAPAVSFDLQLLGGVPRPEALLTEEAVEAARRVLAYEGVPMPEEILAGAANR